MNRTPLLIALLAFVANMACAQQKGLTSGQNYSFTETKVMPKMNKTTVRKGTMRYDAPDNLTMDYSQPAGDYTHITSTTFDVCKSGKVQHFPVSNPKQRMTVFRATLLYCLGGEVANAAKLNNATMDESSTPAARICTLTVEKAAPRDIAKMQLEYDLRTGALLSLTITEGNGNYTTYAISR